MKEGRRASDDLLVEMSVNVKNIKEDMCEMKEANLIQAKRLRDVEDWENEKKGTLSWLTWGVRGLYLGIAGGFLWLIRP